MIFDIGGVRWEKKFPRIAFEAGEMPLGCRYTEMKWERGETDDLVQAQLLRIGYSAQCARARSITPCGMDGCIGKGRRKPTKNLERLDRELERARLEIAALRGAL